jgi:peptide-methionine (S)-S-oxide reductase
MDGVHKVTSGYSGGEEKDPTYLDVKHQATRHRETIRIDYDGEKVTFRELMDIFLNGVDPFDEGGQYIDRGHSYTLAIYYLSQEEKQIAERAISALETASGQKVYISVEPFKSFYIAEEEHQDYYLKHPEEFRQELIDSGRLKV